MALPTIQVQEYSVQNAMILLSNTIRNWIDDNVVYIRQPREKNVTLNDIVDPGIFFIGAEQYGLEASYSSGALLFVINNGHINVKDDGNPEIIENVKDIQMLLNLDNFSIKMRTKNSDTETIFENAWVVAGGSSDAAAILTADLLITEPIGRITQETLDENNGFYTIEKLNNDNTPKTIEQVLNDLLSETKDPTKVDPSISITGASQMKQHEVGVHVDISYQIIANPGSYSFGPETGVTFSNFKAILNGKTIQGQSGEFKDIQIIDNMNATLIASADHTAGVKPNNNKGEETLTNQIEADSISIEFSKKLSGYRKTFYGTVDHKNELTSDIIRGLTGQSSQALKKGSTFNIEIPEGALRVIIAYPASLGELKSVVQHGGLTIDITEAFPYEEMEIEGANNYAAIPYKVYTLTYANANTEKNLKYVVTI